MPTSTENVHLYVTKQGSPAPDGSPASPYHVLKSALVRGNQLRREDSQRAVSIFVGPGKYYETLIINTPVTMTAPNGIATIGKLDYQAISDLSIITLNTHLAGGQAFMPSWKDKARAFDIAHFFGNGNPRPDLVAFQEIWDEELFFGNGAAGILPMSDYAPNGDHGQIEIGWFGANSGLALMSKHTLDDFTQLPWGTMALGLCADVDCLANKGFVTTTIEKDEFRIKIFNIHTQADDYVTVRANQLNLLSTLVDQYRSLNRSDVVFIVGDFNVPGETTEYSANLIPIMGDFAGGRDAHRNSPGFPFNSARWTYSANNQLAIYFDEDAVSARLDYIFYFPSKDKLVEILPSSTIVLPFRGRNLCDDGICTIESSDHWSIFGQFKLIRVAE